MNQRENTKQNRGYTLLLAVLISSIILAMSLGIFSIAYNEIVLATFARDSTRANAAASRALECAVFFDRINQHAAQDHGLAATYYDTRTKNTYTPFARGTSVDFTNNYPEAESWAITPGSALPQGGGNWTLDCGSVASAGYTAVPSASTTGASTLSYNFTDACADVIINKAGIDTTFISNGYSDCNAANVRRTLRVIQVTMNI
jgi:hypothetical protein